MEVLVKWRKKSLSLRFFRGYMGIVYCGFEVGLYVIYIYGCFGRYY